MRESSLSCQQLPYEESVEPEEQQRESQHLQFADIQVRAIADFVARDDVAESGVGRNQVPHQCAATGLSKLEGSIESESLPVRGTKIPFCGGLSPLLRCTFLDAHSDALFGCLSGFSWVRGTRQCGPWASRCRRPSR